MKRVYFVRHGESESNVSGVLTMDGMSPLTRRGREQASFVARRFQSVSIDCIVSSNFTRAKETAQSIASVANVPIYHTDLAAEKRIPSGISGLAPEDPRRIEITESVAANHLNDAWRHSDEENWADLKTRATAFLGYLIDRKEETVLVVTHGWFLKVTIATMLFGEELTAEESFRLWKFLKVTNTGITICDYDPKSDMHPWRMISWNDISHLGDAQSI